jgi:hypothetical protein
VEEAKRWVEAEREAGEPRFRFEQGVEVVEDRAGRVDRRARAAGQRRGALPEREPLGRDATLLGRLEADLNVAPAAPVGTGGVGLDQRRLVEGLSVIERQQRALERALRVGARRQPSEQLLLSFELLRQQRLADCEAAGVARRERLRPAQLRLRLRWA